MVIIQPTPEIESKPSLGEQEEEPTETSEPDEEFAEQVTTVEVVVNPDFTLDKPTPKPPEGLSFCIYRTND